MAKVLSKGQCGGRSATAKAGGYTQGLQFAAQGGHSGGVGSHQDLRGGNAKAGGYNQGPVVSGQKK